MKRHLIRLLLLCFTLSYAIGPMPVSAQEMPSMILPKPGVMVALSPPTEPIQLSGVKIVPGQPWQLDFLFDVPPHLTEQDSREDMQRLITYFLVGLTIPEKDWWVNLSPYEKDRIIPDNFGQTQLGRDLLAEDYLLKQVTATLLYPEGEIGKKFWSKVYAQAQKQYGTTQIPINTFNKVWIIPQKAVVYENKQNQTAYVVGTKLKVMLEEDYLALAKHDVGADLRVRPRVDTQVDPYEKTIGSQIIRELVLPALETEVNNSQNFAHLRQIVHTLALASWYKKRFMTTDMGEGVVNQSITKGLVNNGFIPKDIYQRYVQAYKKGAFNFIREETDQAGSGPSPTTIPRKYFSGGMVLASELPGATDFAMNGLQISTDPSLLGSTKVFTHKQVRINVGAKMDSAMKVTLEPKRDFKSLSERWLKEVQSHINLILTESKTQKPVDSVMAWQSYYQKEKSRLETLHGQGSNALILRTLNRINAQVQILGEDVQDSFASQEGLRYLVKNVFWKEALRLTDLLEASAIAVKDEYLMPTQKVAAFFETPSEEAQEFNRDLQRMYPVPFISKATRDTIAQSLKGAITAGLLLTIVLWPRSTSENPDKPVGPRKTNTQEQAKPLKKDVEEKPIEIPISVAELTGKSQKEEAPKLPEIEEILGQSPTKGKQSEGSTPKDELFKDKIKNIDKLYDLKALRKAVDKFDPRDGAWEFADKILKGYLMALANEKKMDAELESRISEKAFLLGNDVGQALGDVRRLMREPTNQLTGALQSLKDILISKRVFCVIFTYQDNNRPFVFLYAQKIIKEMELSETEVGIISGNRTFILPFSALLITKDGLPLTDFGGYFDGKNVIVFEASSTKEVPAAVSQQWTAYHELMHAYEQWLYKKYKIPIGNNVELNPVLAPLMLSDKPSDYFEHEILPFYLYDNPRNLYSQAAMAIVRAANEYLKQHGITQDVRSWIRQQKNSANVNHMFREAYRNPQWFGEIPKPETFDNIDFGNELTNQIDNGAPPKFSDSSWRWLDTSYQPGLVTTALQDQAKRDNESIDTQAQQNKFNDWSNDQVLELIKQLEGVQTGSMSYRDLVSFQAQTFAMLDKLIFNLWLPSFQAEDGIIEKLQQAQAEMIQKVQAEAQSKGWVIVRLDPQGETIGNFVVHREGHRTVIVNGGSSWLLPPGYTIAQVPTNGIAIAGKKSKGKTEDGKEVFSRYKIVGNHVSEDVRAKEFVKVVPLFAFGDRWLMWVQEQVNGRQYVVGHWPGADPNLWKANMFQYTTLPDGVEFEDVEKRKYAVSIDSVDRQVRDIIFVQEEGSGQIVPYNGGEVPEGLLPTHALTFKNNQFGGELARQAGVEHFPASHIVSQMSNGSHWIVMSRDAVNNRMLVFGSMFPKHFHIPDSPEEQNLEIKFLTEKGEWLGMSYNSTLVAEHIFGSLVPDELKHTLIDAIDVKTNGKFYVIRIIPKDKQSTWYLSNTDNKVTVVRGGSSLLPVKGTELTIDEEGNWLDVVKTDGESSVITNQGSMIFKKHPDGYHAEGALADMKVYSVASPRGVLVPLSSVIFSSQPNIFKEGDRWFGLFSIKTSQGIVKQIIGSTFKGEYAGPDLLVSGGPGTEPVISTRSWYVLHGKKFNFPTGWSFGNGFPEHVRDDVTGLDGVVLTNQNKEFQMAGPLADFLGITGKVIDRKLLYGYLKRNGSDIPPAEMADVLRAQIHKEAGRIPISSSTVNGKPSLGQQAVNIHFNTALNSSQRTRQIRTLLEQMAQQTAALDDSRAIIPLFEDYQGDFLAAASQLDGTSLQKVLIYLKEMKKDDWIYDILVYCQQQAKWSSAKLNAITGPGGFKKEFWGGVFEKVRLRNSSEHNFFRTKSARFDVEMDSTALNQARYRAIRALRENLNELKLSTAETIVFQETTYAEQYAQFLEENHNLNALFPVSLGTNSLSDQEVKDQLEEEIAHDAFMLLLIIGALNLACRVERNIRSSVDWMGLSYRKVKKSILKLFPNVDQKKLDTLLEAQELLENAFRELGKTNPALEEAFRNLTPEEGAIINLLSHLPKHLAADNRESNRISLIRVIPAVGGLVNMFYPGPNGYVVRQKMLKEIRELARQYKKDPKLGPQDLFQKTADLLGKYDDSHEDAEGFAEVLQSAKKVMVQRKSPQVEPTFLSRLKAQKMRLTPNGSQEFHSQRQYVPGDEVRKIDWKVWGRSDRYYVKQFTDETPHASLDLVFNVQRFNRSQGEEREALLAELWQMVSLGKSLRKRLGRVSVNEIYIIDDSGILQAQPIQVKSRANEEDQFLDILKLLSPWFVYDSAKLEIYDGAATKDSNYRRASWNTPFSGSLPDQLSHRILLSVGVSPTQMLPLVAQAKKKSNVVFRLEGDQLIQADRAVVAPDTGIKGGVDLTDTSAWVGTSSEEAPISDRSSSGKFRIFSMTPQILFIKDSVLKEFVGIS